MFTEMEAVLLPPDTKLFLISLLTEADDANGNVMLDIKKFTKRVLVKLGQTEDDIERWVFELVEAEWVEPYTVDGQRYLTVVGWQDKNSFTFQYIDKTKMQQWTNPTPIGDASDTAVVPRVRRDDGRSGQPRGRGSASRGRATATAERSDDGIRDESEAPRRVLKLRKPSKGPEPRSPMQKRLKIAPRASQEAEEAYDEEADDELFDVRAKMALLGRGLRPVEKSLRN
jgi:hypothetical protein